MDPLGQGSGRNPPEDDQGAPPAKKVKLKRFFHHWASMPEFAGWLKAEQDDPTRAFCSCCQKSLKCGKSELTRHAATTTHQRNAAIAILKNVRPTPEKEQVDDAANAHQTAVKAAEIKLAAFYAEHNIGIQTVEHLVPLIKDIFHDSRIAQDVKLGRTKCTKLITNCLGAREQEKLMSILKYQKFSVLVDESTDITDTKTLCVLVQFVSPKTKLIATELLELIDLDARDCSAEKVYFAFKSCLESKGVPIANIVGMASDNASVMTGINDSFMTRLKLDAPRLVVLNCICHSSALIASKACLTLPRSCEDLIRSIAKYVSGSAKRCAVLREFQELLDVESRKILKLSDTRWLSMQKCVTRLLENWDVLQLYFVHAVTEDKLKSAETICQQLYTGVIRAYFLFMKYVLNFFNSFNALFQSRKVLIHRLAEESRLLISQFGNNFLKREVLRHLESGTLNVSHPTNFLALEQVVVGPECEIYLSSIGNANDVFQIRQTCLTFYITAATEMQKRLPLKHSFLDDLRFLAPSIALNSEDRGSVRDLSAVAARFGEFDLTKLAFEWNSLPSAFTAEKRESLLTLEVDLFWKEVLQCRDFSDEPKFPNLEQLVCIALSLPHSNAEAERIFSIVTDVKTKKRNKIGNKCLNAICQVRSAFQNAQVDCRSFEVDAQHLELHNSNNLYSATNPDAE